MKIAGIVLTVVIILVLLFFLFGGAPKEETPAQLPAAEIPEPSLPAQVGEDLPQPEEPAGTKTAPAAAPPKAELPKCGHRNFLVRILAVDKAEPANLTVHLGDTAMFVNEDNDLRWPGADPHPTHSSLPLLDALGGISYGQSYSHTFKKEGVFGWHDHILDNPPTVGYITVLPCEEVI